MKKKYIIINNVNVYKNIIKQEVAAYYTLYIFNNGTKYVEGNLIYNIHNKKGPLGYKYI